MGKYLDNILSAGSIRFAEAEFKCWTVSGVSKTENNNNNNNNNSNNSLGFWQWYIIFSAIQILEFARLSLIKNKRLNTTFQKTNASLTQTLKMNRAQISRFIPN